MMGSKKWSAIEKELCQALGSRRQRIQAWLDKEQVALQKRGKGRMGIAEELEWIRAYLQLALAGSKSQANRPTPTKKRKARA